MEKIRIVHTNDLHSHFENWPKIRRYLFAAQKDQTVAQTLTFDLGDFMDRSHPLTDATDGQANIDLLNEIHYDATTIGNNEGIGNGHETLEHLYDQANFDVILGNLFEPDGIRPDFVKTYKIITTAAQTRIGIVGFTAPYPMSYEPNNWQIKLISETLPAILAELQDKTDYLIMLSHLGLTMDRYLAKQFPELNLIIGSHSHHLLLAGEQIGQTYLAAAEKWGHYVGDIHLEFDEQHQIQATKVVAVPTAELPAEASDEHEAQELFELGEKLLEQEQVAVLPEAFAEVKTSVDAGLAAIADFTGTDLAILNTGLFLGHLQPGLLTKKDLHNVLPHPMHVVKITLSGQDLWRLIMEMEKNRNFLSKFKIVGMSFRGKIFGDLVYQGLSFDQKTRGVFVHGEELDPLKQYQVAILDHYIFIPFFPTIEIMAEKKIYFPYFFRDVVGHYLSQKYPLKEVKQ